MDFDALVQLHREDNVSVMTDLYDFRIYSTSKDDTEWKTVLCVRSSEARWGEWVGRVGQAYNYLVQVRSRASRVTCAPRM